MRRIAFVLVAAWRAGRRGAPTWPACPLDRPMVRPHRSSDQNSRRIPRLAVDLRGPRRRHPQRSARHSGQRHGDQGVPGRTLPFPDGTIIARLAWITTGWRKAKKPSAGPNRSWPGNPRTGSSSWSRTREGTPPPAAGGSLTLTSASPPARRCTTPALLATRSPNRATLSSTDTHLDTCSKKSAALAAVNSISQRMTGNLGVEVHTHSSEEKPMRNDQ